MARQKGNTKSSSPALLLAGMASGPLLLLAFGGVVAWALLHQDQGPTQTEGPSPPAPLRPGPGGAPAAPAGDPAGGNTAFRELAQRLTGRWTTALRGGGKVVYDYRADGTFTVQLLRGTASVTATGNWKVVGVGLDSGQLRRTGSGAAAEFCEPNDAPTVYFTPEGRLLHSVRDGAVLCTREDAGAGQPGAPGVEQAAQEKAVEAIRARGGQVTRAPGLAAVQPDAPVQGVDLSRTRAGDADLVRLANLPQLRELDLSGTHVSDSGLAHLTGLKGLQVLDLSDNPGVTDAGLAHLRGLGNLEHLRVGYNPRITNAGLAPLKGLARLRRLCVRGTSVTDAGVADLREALLSLRLDEN